MIKGKLFVSGALLGMAIQVLGACGSDNPDAKVNAGETDNSRPTEASQPGRLAASEASAALGVRQWELSPLGLTRALDEAGNVVAEFVLDGKQGVIQMRLPDVGSRPFADPSKSTLSPRGARYVEAFRADLEASLPNSARGEVPNASEDKGVYACYMFIEHCWNTCDWGILNGWWIGCDCRYPWFSCGNPSYPFALLY